MKIAGTRILNVARYTGHLPENAIIRVIFDATDVKDASLQRAGFSAEAAAGSAILPAIVGPATRFNAEGKWIIHRDQPKELRYVGTRVWRWKQWGGEEQESYVDIERECYPRTRVDPPSIELSLLDNSNRLLIVSPEISLTDGDTAKLAINIFLELFRACELITTHVESYSPPEISRVNWRLLPPGEYPWERLSTHIESALKKSSDDLKEIIQDRQDTIRAYGPSRIFVGQAGFGDYLAYEFSGRSLVVLESIRRDNAIYIFGQDWQAVSQFTKAQVIGQGLHLERIIHSKGWKAKLANALS